MKHLLRRSIILSVFALALSLGNVPEANAQVPSIPKTHKSSKKTKKSSSSSANVVWGTSFDWLSTCYVTYEDIMYMDSGQIRVLKNSIYARHGRKFKDSRLRAYFNSFSWYYGYRNEVPMGELNKYEKANIMFLKKYE